jgi:exodeoxyribonuclease VII large subunit
LEDGQRVVLQGQVTVYPPRGRMQFIAVDVVQTRRGELLEQLEKLKKKLAAEGLFDEARKKKLPDAVRRFAVLTSRDGAAIHDVVRVAQQRGRVSILLVPTPVQGVAAADGIAEAIARSDMLHGVDVILVTRGGGSAEDLAAYNDERVVRAIAAASKPVVSAVGHEIDVSLSDLAADVRAATPSQAAEILVADDSQRRAMLRQLESRLGRGVTGQLERIRAQLERLRARLGEPRRRILEQSQRFDELAAAAERFMRRRVTTERAQIERLARRLRGQHPSRVLGLCRARIAPLEPRLATAMRRQLQAARRETVRLGARLEALSPLAVLERGYAIASRADGGIIRRAGDVAVGDSMTVRLHEGAVRATVDECRDVRDAAPGEADAD